MPTGDWRGVVTDPKHVAAFEALEDPNWDWRTAASVAKASGLSEHEVARLPDLYPSFVRRAPAPGPGAEYLYTLHSKFYAQQPAIAKVLTFLSSSSSSSSQGGAR